MNSILKIPHVSELSFAALFIVALCGSAMGQSAVIIHTTSYHIEATIGGVNATYKYCGALVATVTAGTSAATCTLGGCEGYAPSSTKSNNAINGPTPTRSMCLL